MDIPIHALVRAKLAFLGLEGFGGYYISAYNSSSYSFSGFEVGAKILLGGVYVSASEIFATTPYTRVEIGYEFTDLLRF
ncbi:MAG: hypothetical protein PQJ46_09540 [Spirochaetales bacterium]|nr:hypothetical protein [Spirochaetales bacterium]